MWGDAGDGVFDAVGLGDLGVVSGVGRCVGIVGDGEDGAAAGDGDGEGVVLAWLLVVLAFPVVWMLLVVVLGAGRWVARL